MRPIALTGAMADNRAVRFSLLLLASLSLPAQNLRVYSELAKISAGGEALAPLNPREILSPAIARNAFTSFQIVVQVVNRTRYTLYLGENPEGAVRVKLYREAGDRLEPVDLPYEGEGPQVFWMDLWADREAPVRRIKIEPQLNVNGGWVNYPMEVRVMDATVPGVIAVTGSASPMELMRSLACGTDFEPGAGNALSLARMHFRNAQQDIALARRTPKEELRRLIGGCDAEPGADPELYLRVRDYLYRMR